MIHPDDVVITTTLEVLAEDPRFHEVDALSMEQEGELIDKILERLDQLKPADMRYTGTVTGRISSKEPNLSSIPRAPDCPTAPVASEGGATTGAWLDDLHARLGDSPDPDLERALIKMAEDGHRIYHFGSRLPWWLCDLNICVDVQKQLPSYVRTCRAALHHG